MISHWNEQRIREKLPMPTAIAAMREAFLAISDGRARAPQRHNIALLNEQSRFLVMPSYMAGSRFACVKIVSICPQNVSQNKPTIIGTLQAFDAESGELVATFDAETITALRTGAASALATDCLAPSHARTLAVFGCGAQAMTQVEAINVVRPLSRLVVFGRDAARTAAFCQHWQQRLGIDVAIGTAALLREADIIATATTSATPLFAADALANSVHINAVGSYAVQRSELPPALLSSATVVVDSRTASAHEAGEIAQALQQGYLASLSEVVELGECLTAPLLQTRPITVFKSVGHAMQDLLCVRVLLDDVVP